MSFMVIAAADGLSQENLNQLLRDGREDLKARPGYPTLLAQAGLTMTDLIDVTEGYAETQEAWIAEWTAGAEELIELFGEEEFNDRQARRVRSLNSIRDKHVVRYWITAVKA